MSPPPQRPGLGGNRPERRSVGFLASIVRTLLTFGGFVVILYFLGFIKLPLPGGAKLHKSGPKQERNPRQDHRGRTSGR